MADKCNGELWKIFENTNRWLEYSEKKNTLLLSINSLVLTLITLFFRFFLSPEQNAQKKWIIIVFFTLALISLFFSIISFFPKSKLTNLSTIRRKDKTPMDAKSLIFYGHIATLSKQEYVNELNRRFGDDFVQNDFEKEVIEQVLVNSEIANNKFILFKRGFSLVLIEFLIIIYLIIKVTL